jgi:hypothetical protein
MAGIDHGQNAFPWHDHLGSVPCVLQHRPPSGDRTELLDRTLMPATP